MTAWDRRIERAEELASTCSSAAEVLRFYGKIARLQKTVYEQLKGRPEISVLLPHFGTLLSLVKHAGPAPLVRMADELAQNRKRWEALLAGWRHAGRGEEFFARALLQPYTEYMARQSDVASGTVQPRCPFCGERPQVGVLRGEGEGGKRSLICSLCSTEWEFRRILCLECGEESERKLPVYTAEEFPHVRIEACDTCRSYIKSVDFTKNGLAVPVVDELAAIPLDLWAQEHGYTKLQVNLLGM